MTMATAIVRLTKDRAFKQHLSWSPDGKKLLCTRLYAGKMGLWTMDAAGGEWKALLGKDALPHFDAGWHPGSKKIVFVYDVLHGTDGKLQINTIDADGANNRVLIPNQAFEESPRWSPDGKRIVFVSTRDGNQEIYVASADGKTVDRLTRETAADNNPNWSPDGKQIAFTSNRDGNYEIYVMNADGSAQRNLTQHPSQDNYVAWSPDGKRLAFISNRGGGYDVYVVDLQGPR